MLEPDITRKCLATLAAAGAVAGFSLFASWWLTVPEREEPAAVRLVSRTGVPPAPSIEPPADPVPAATPLAWRSALETDVPAPAAPGGGGSEPWERRAFELEQDNVRLRGRLDDMLTWILDNVRGTFPLPEEQMAHLRINPVDENLGVSEDLIRLLRINEEETSRLDSALAGTRAALWNVEADYIQVETPADNQVVLSIPPYPVEGEELRGALYSQMENTLGEGRFLRFLQVAESGLDESFDYFGTADRLLQFEAVLDDATGDPQLYVRDERALPNREDPLRLDIIASERLVEELPAEYLPYWDWLPESVTRFAVRN
ncbi:MAG: hypothetical protein EOM10_05970 [Opitutae bacterium]|nr:hypothetical protein [Opitutae bacterium]